jgi:hypothetical protein
VYLSFDLDVLEPGLVPGISHREAGGLTVRQAIGIVQRFEGALVGADLVEFNPANDPSGVTARRLRQAGEGDRGPHAAGGKSVKRSATWTAIGIVSCPPRP